MADKPKIAFYWCASCGGCEEAVVDLAENILPVVQAVDIVLWPVALDFKKKDVEAYPDGSIAVTFINGAIRNEEHIEWVEMLRKKSQLIVAFGACAHLGGIPSMGNLFSTEQLLEECYINVPSMDNPEKNLPETEVKIDGYELTIPAVLGTCRKLDQVIDVDYYLPGCAPTPKLIQTAVEAILSGKLPPKGSVIASNKTLCDECSRKDTKPEKLSLDDIYRPHEIIADNEKCLLAQGLLCMGPVTRGGCEERCVSVNMPCRGCFGPADGIIDMGSKYLSGLASIIDIKDEKDFRKFIEKLPDPAGIFYRFTMASSLLVRANKSKV